MGAPLQVSTLVLPAGNTTGAVLAGRYQLVVLRYLNANDALERGTGRVVERKIP